MNADRPFSTCEASHLPRAAWADLARSDCSRTARRRSIAAIRSTLVIGI
jgi:hypothetical protein